jgi:prephenate dehydrogenase
LPVHRQNFPRPLSLPASLAVFGPGLIGGSILLACARLFPEIKLRAWSRKFPALEKVQAGLGDEVFVSTDAAEVAQEATGLIFCTPVEFMEDLAREIAPTLGEARWLTDAGSVKGDLVRRLEDILGSRYVGAHPMAGSEKSGFEHARADLFTGSVCLLTPTASTSPEAADAVAEFWRGLGCDILFCEPHRHDELVARVSHLPHVVAAALAQIVPGEALPLAGSGFRDSTRIAMGDAAMWAGILLENREAVLSALQEMEGQLQIFTTALREQSRSVLQKELLSAARQRRQLS